MGMSGTGTMLKDHGLTTAEFFCHMPDHVHVPDSFNWQEEIDGPLHPVRVTRRKLISAGECRNVLGEFGLT